MRIFRVAIAVLLLWLAASAAIPALAATPEVERLEGFVDGSAFCDLAGEDGEVVEISLGPAILSALARGAGTDADLAPLLDGLRSISACIVSFRGDPVRAGKADRLVREMESRLDRSGWERLARVRDGGERVDVFVRNDERAVRGVTILVLGRDDGEVVFVNLAGTIDLARIGELGDSLDVPGLDELKKGEAGPGEGR